MKNSSTEVFKSIMESIKKLDYYSLSLSLSCAHTTHKSIKLEGGDSIKAKLISKEILYRDKT